MFDSTSRAMLRSICEQPDDDVTRLVLADYLEEQGQPERAEFIRVQVALACGYDPATAAREAELLAAHGDHWRTEVPEWARPGSGFRRGFVAEVRCTVGDWIVEAQDLVAQTPVEEVFFVPGPTDVLRLAQSRALARLQTLILCNAGLRTVGLRDLVDSPYLTNLRELFLAGNDLDDDAPLCLATAENLANLTELDLRDNRLGDVGAVLLATEGSQLGRLITLYLVNNLIGDVGAQWLAEGPWRNLAHLYLNHNQIGDGGVEALAASSQMSQLVELDLRDNRIGEEGARCLSASPYLGNVRTLLVRGNPISTAGYVTLRRHFGDRLKM